MFGLMWFEVSEFLPLCPFCLLLMYEPLHSFESKMKDLCVCVCVCVTFLGDK